MTTKNHKAQWLRDNLKKGETYAGLILGKNGDHDYHLIVLPGRDNKSMPWDAAMKAAKAEGGDLPTRREQSLLFANLKEEFKPDWYWSNEKHASDASYAWLQYFSYGGQDYYLIHGQCRAVAVRRLIIE